MAIARYCGKTYNNIINVIWEAARLKILYQIGI